MAKRTTKKITEEVAREWLKDHAPHLILLEWSGHSNVESKFKDCNRNIEFNYKFKHAKAAIKRNPDAILKASKEERILAQERLYLKKYGVKHPFMLPEVKKKIKKTNLERYGVEHPLQNKEIMNKVKKTNLEKYGVEHSLSSKAVQAKRKKTNLEKYGFEYAPQNIDVMNKSRKTMMEKYGVDHPSKIKGMDERKLKTRIKNGHTILVEGKTLVKLAKEKNCGYTTLTQRYNEFGEEFIKDWQPQKRSYLEHMFSKFLDSEGIEYRNNRSIKLKEGQKYRADFILDDYKLIIECDGLKAHCDSYFSFKGKQYHKKKKEFYDNQGFVSMFFREDEINNKFSIVRSMIMNKIGKCENRIFARKCNIEKVSKKESDKFLNDNHLMGKGHGRSYGLYHEKKLVSMIQVKWKKKNKTLEISRFCSKLNHSVIGGWSKLLKHVQDIESPDRIITFVDRRYGSGEYLKNLGWTLESSNLSFMWTDGHKSYHRMKFRGNQGYENNLSKIWDCGQAKYSIEVS